MLLRLEQLEKQIADQIKEAQLKIGFVKETVRLYYPLASLNNLLGTYFESEQQMCMELDKVCSKFTFAIHQGRIEISVPPDYVEYVYREVETPEFLAAWIDLFRNNHSIQLSQVKEIFAKFGEYVCQKMPERADFDYVLHFEDESVDAYYYCIKMEMGHTVYHRFIKEDYESLYR